jgi:hypothetical protein
MDLLLEYMCHGSVQMDLQPASFEAKYLVKPIAQRASLRPFTEWLSRARREVSVGKKAPTAWRRN